MTQRKSYYTHPDRQVQAAPGGARFLPLGAVSRRYDRSPSTITRWAERDDLDFPAPVQFTPFGTLMFSEAELDAFDRRRAALTPESRAQMSAHRKAAGHIPPPRRRKTNLPGASAEADGITITAAVPGALPAQVREPPARLWGRPGAAKPPQPGQSS